MEHLPDDIKPMRTIISNLVMVGRPGTDDWVLVDAGLPTFADNIAEAAREHFSAEKPKAIVLTHGHFDHVGSLGKLLERWEDVPVYAHELELPYLTGQADYPKADPSVGGGLLAGISPVYPHKGIDISRFVRPLPSSGEIPGMPGWKWIHTPGHTRGHISLFRASDHVLLAGDAFITVKQESAFAVIAQKREVHGPPAYFTSNWQAAWDSVKKLAELMPFAAVTGHGQPMFGQGLRKELNQLAEDFDRTAIPKKAHSRSEK